ncbi:MAG: hypothetical protein Q4B86_05265 [Eubacteriales bacterium]|nr:hypothetical protein [Eubacteriales bacterium]
MSLILVRQQAKNPYYIEQLDLNIWSEQELSYVIYQYSLLLSDSFINEDLIMWIEKELDRGDLAAELKKSLDKQDSNEGMFLTILQYSSYYSANEINSFREKLILTRRREKWEKLHMVGTAFFKLGYFRQAKEKYEAAIKALDETTRKLDSLAEREVLVRRKTDFMCDIACVMANLFDIQGAKSILDKADMLYKNPRIERLRYLMDRSGKLSEDEKLVLDRKIADTKENVLKSASYRNAESIFFKDNESCMNEASLLLKKLKHEYHKMV